MANKIFVRAIDPNGRWHSANAKDLKDESFKRFVLGKLAQAEIVVSVINDEQEEPLYCTCIRPEDE